MRKETKKKGTFATNCNLFLLIAVIAITMLALGGCMDKAVTNAERDSNNWSPKLDPLVEQQIVQDWNEQSCMELTKINYYGTHNGYVAFFMLGENTVVTIVEIAGTTFEYGYDWTIYLWKDDRFHEMVEAYEQGLLTAENIRAIGQIHAKFRKEGLI